ncbi:MAG: hypothetical protein R2697_00510 [Ilumatobacteraceae bacterium]
MYEAAIGRLDSLSQSVAESRLGEAVRDAHADEELYLAELAAAGIDPDGYRRLTEELVRTDYESLSSSNAYRILRP